MSTRTDALVSQQETGKITASIISVVSGCHPALVRQLFRNSLVPPLAGRVCNLWEVSQNYIGGEKGLPASGQLRTPLHDKFSVPPRRASSWLSRKAKGPQESQRLDAANENAIMQRAEVHGFPSLLSSTMSKGRPAPPAQPEKRVGGSFSAVKSGARKFFQAVRSADECGASHETEAGHAVADHQSSDEWSQHR
jgi:hypothetical protein